MAGRSGRTAAAKMAAHATPPRPRPPAAALQQQRRALPVFAGEGACGRRAAAALTPPR
jgi:hypothetical protein